MSTIAPALPRVRALILAPRLVLGAIVLTGTAALDLLARQVVTPSVFPDEYLYSQLGRGLATTGHLTVRGVNPHFLPVLQPLLTAPLWLVHDVGLAFRLIQLENAFVLSLSAIPAYLIARRLGVGNGLALGVALLAVCGPPALFTGMVMAEPFAYLLSLLVVLAALHAFDRPSVRAQLVLLGVSGLATFDRLQLGALPLCVALTMIVVGLRQHRLRAAVREQWLVLGAFAVGLLGGIGYGALRGFGYYHLRPRPLGLTHALGFAGMSGYIVLLAAGAAIAPAALVGLVQAIGRPRSRGELAFGVLTVSFAAVLLTQCVLWGDVHRIQERYLGYLLPLLGISFALRCSRRERRPVAEIGVAAGIAVVAAAVPLSGYAIDAQHNLIPTLYAFTRIQFALGRNATLTATLFALGATLLAALGAVGMTFRRGPAIALAASVIAAATLLGFGVSWSGLLSHDARRNYLPADAQWVDHAATGKSTMLVVGNAWNGQALATLFWNPGISRVLRLPGSNKVDWLDDPIVRVSHLGSVSLAGRPVRGDVLVDTAPGVGVAMRDAQPVGHFGAATLWRAAGVAQLGAIMNNRLSDGRVLHSGGMEIWTGKQQLAGWIELRVHAPKTLGNATLKLDRTPVHVPAGATRVVRVKACGAGPWTGGFAASPVKVVASSWRSPIVSMPRYVPDPKACS